METETTASEAQRGRRPVVRKMDFSFEGLPKKWFADAIYPTQIVNGLHLVFPAGERFFIRSVRHYLGQVKDPELQQRVKGFFGQEARHGLEHEVAFAMLEKQGYVVKPFLEMYERIAYKVIEPRMPPSVSLAVTVALEHYTAALAEEALATRLLDRAHPAMRDLLQWHASEEIEHKSVAFDVFNEVDGRYWMRMVGLGVGSLMFVAFWSMGTRMLLKQENLSQDERRVERKKSGRLRHNLAAIPRAFVQYLKPGFHPDQIKNSHIADEYLEKIGRRYA